MLAGVSSTTRILGLLIGRTGYPLGIVQGPLESERDTLYGGEGGEGLRRPPEVEQVEGLGDALDFVAA